MAKLNEYIGSIVSSITNARVMADLQSAKVAREYNKHELLRHFSVPRMRIGDVELTIPVALEDVVEKSVTVYEPIDNSKFNSIVYREFLNALGLKTMPEELSEKLRSQIASATNTLEEAIRATNDLEHLMLYSKRIAELLMRFAKEMPKLSKTVLSSLSEERFAKRLNEVLRPEIKIADTTTEIEHLEVILESHKLREFRPENIITIKLTITEEGMEWSREQRADGSVDEKLLPE